jgi:predicted Zn finger-like uncharacterized protein
MKLECTGCQARYTIDDAIIPPQGAKIRCKKCSAVIVVPARVEPAPTATPLVPPTPQATDPPGVSAPFAPAPAAPRAPSLEPAVVGMGGATGQPSTHSVPYAPPSAPSTTGLPRPQGTPIPADLPAAERARHEKARRLARVLASDIAIYNREKKDRGLADGNLVAVLGYEIKKSWEIFKERVGADFANETPYFRDALNDLLADGKKIF